MEPSGGQQGASAEDSEATLKKERLREAGREYFEKVLASQGRGGAVPYSPDLSGGGRRAVGGGGATGVSAGLSSSRGASGGGLGSTGSGGPVQHSYPGGSVGAGRRKAPTPVDPDLEAVGAVIEGGSFFALAAVLCIATAAFPVLLKGALLTYQAPALLVAVHGVITALLLALLASQGFGEEIGALTLNTLKAALPSAAVTGIKALCFFAALVHGSVYTVLAVTIAAPPALRFAFQRVFMGVSPDPLPVKLITIALGGAAACIVLDFDQGMLCLACLIAWTVADAVGVTWRAAKATPELQTRLVGLSHSAVLADAIAAEDALPTGAKNLYAALLPAAPALLLSMFFELEALRAHEVNVPALSLAAGSCAAAALAVAASFGLRNRVRRSARAMLYGAAALGTILLDFLERAHELSKLMLLAVIVAVFCATAARVRAAKSPSPL